MNEFDQKGKDEASSSVDRVIEFLNSGQVNFSIFCEDSKPSVGFHPTTSAAP